MLDISKKTNHVLHIISVCFILILIRVWYLGIIQHDYHVQQSKKPQRRVVLEKADRAAIYDRFGIPLAVNKIQYNAAVCYADIRQIPSIIWKTDEEGKRVKVFARVEYIDKLSETLSRELGIDKTKIEDIIHGKAAMLPHTPFVLKEEISEEQYYRLRMMEKDWLGLQAQRSSRRLYPMGKVGCDIIGYLGTIDQNRYLRIAHELRTLETYLTSREREELPFLPEGFNTPEEVQTRFLELQEKAYGMNDLVGKSGIECFLEEDLRGYWGKKIYEVDIKGNCLQELPGSRMPLPGKKVTLTISSELQEFAEQLLASAEGPRLENTTIDENWMRGGSIVAMIPKTGEVVAMASYPRFDPNDFITTGNRIQKSSKEASIRKWLENDTYLGEIWDGKRPLEREYFSFVKGDYLQETVPLTWGRYLEAIMPLRGMLPKVMKNITTLSTALHIQEIGLDHPALSEIESESDRHLALELCHLIAPKELFSQELTAAVSTTTVEQHHADRQAAIQLLSAIKPRIQDYFSQNDFRAWRNENFKEYLKQKRQEEKEHKRYAKPYTDYLDQAEKKLFQAFWDAYKSMFLYAAVTQEIPISTETYDHLLPYFALLKDFPFEKGGMEKKLHSLPPQLRVEYLKTLRSFEDLTTPLQNHYPNLRSFKGKQLEKHLAGAFYPLYGYSYIRSFSYQQPSVQGSVFKLITAYQAMLERYQLQQDLNPLSLIDDLKGSPFSNARDQILGYTLDRKPLMRSYKGARLPRSSHSGIGQVDMTSALETSSNIFFAILADDYIQDPRSLAKAAESFCLGKKTGIELPGESKGNLPDDLDQNKSGLYSFSIGQHTMEVTTLQTAAMMSAIANQGNVLKPYIVLKKEGPNRTLHYEEETQPQIERTIPFPDEIFKMLKIGMQKVVSGTRGTARYTIMRAYHDHPMARKDYLSIYQDLLAKTGTAQVMYKKNISKTSRASIRNHVWFASIAYPKGHLLSQEIPDDPELVVVVFLRFRRAGREGGTIAAQMVNKWREIKTKHNM